MSGDRYDDLIAEALRLPKSSALRLPILEEAVREADRFGNEQRGYESRSLLIGSADHAGQPDRALPAFTWCLAYADRQGDDFPDTLSLLWDYKGMAADLVSYPDVSREQIVAVEADLERRIERHGYSLRPLLDIRWSNALVMGDDERGRELFERWRGLPSDELSNCDACDVNAIVYFHVVMDEHKAALRHAAPILSGELDCNSVPHTTYANLLEVLAALGRLDEADDYQRKGYRLISRDRIYLDTIGDHLKYLVYRENWDRALRMFERHFDWSLETTCLSDVFEFELASWMLFTRLAARGNRPRKLRMAHSFPARSDDERYRPSVLAAWFEKRVRELARRFDDRNGNDAHARSMDDAMKYTGVTDDIDGAQP